MLNDALMIQNANKYSYRPKMNNFMGDPSKGSKIKIGNVRIMQKQSKMMKNSKKRRKKQRHIIERNQIYYPTY